MILNSLYKVFLDTKPELTEAVNFTFFKNEKYSFQEVFYSPNEEPIKVTVNCKLPLKLFKVGQVFVSSPELKGEEIEDAERHEKGFYPDVLYPIENDTEITVSKGWNSIWVTVCGECEVGEYPFEITVGDITESTLLTVLPAQLPEQKLIYTAWFHNDCIADWYNCEIFDDKYWSLLKDYLLNAVAYGQNMIYVPLYTPPLDTEVGSERRTAQLVDISLEGDKYSFGFDNVKRWMLLAKECGFKYFEMPHLFTQWGAAATPKIMVNTAEGKKRIFGWDVASVSDEYKSFLNQFIPVLKCFLDDEGFLEQTFFHYSDEPSQSNIEQYTLAHDVAAPLLKGLNTMDAVSDYTFYERGLFEIPVVATDHTEKFLEKKVSPLWVYYCCCQVKEVCGRFVSMHSYSNRAFGYQLFMNNISGFLHWGYNYWYTKLSKEILNPFTGMPDDKVSFPAGDGYVVYPGDKGPLASIRQVVFNEALQDLRACELLAEKIGRPNVEKILLEYGFDYSFKKYPHSAETLLALRDRINSEIV